jgi:acyl carrier protein
VVLTSLPLTAGKKLDRRALPDPGHARPEIDTPFIAPRSALEAAIAGQWAAALGLDKVGVRDDFFELGGDSLDSVAILNRVSRLLGAGLPHELVFRAPTVEGMARAIEAHRSNGSSRSTLMTPSISPRCRS